MKVPAYYCRRCALYISITLGSCGLLLLVFVALFNVQLPLSHSEGLFKHNDFPVNSTSYIVIGDAGSSSTRLSVFSAKHGKKEEIFPVLKEITPPLEGLPPLSSIENMDKAELLAAQILAFAESNVPKMFWSSTPIIVYATGGMRRLSQEKRGAIHIRLMTAFDKLFIKERIDKDTSFDATLLRVNTISGQEESWLGWLAVNFAKQTIDFSKPSLSIGTLDFGGSTVELAFALSGQEQSQGSPISYDELDSSPFYYAPDLEDDDGTQRLPSQVDFPSLVSWRGYRVYSGCFNGMGHISALSQYLYNLAGVSSASPGPFFADELLVEYPDGWSSEPVSVSPSDLVVPPSIRSVQASCLPSQGNLWVNSSKYDTHIFASGAGNFAQCKREVSSFLVNTTAPCPYKSCSFNGFYQPELPQGTKFLALTWFAKTMKLLEATLPSSVVSQAPTDVIPRYETLGAAACSRSLSSLSDQMKQSSGTASLDLDLLVLDNALKSICFSAAHASVMLEGMGFARNDTRLELALTTDDGVFLSWPLGVAVVHTSRGYAKQPPAPVPVRFTLTIAGAAIGLLLASGFFFLAYMRCQKAAVGDVEVGNSQHIQLVVGPGRRSTTAPLASHDASETEYSAQL